MPTPSGRRHWPDQSGYFDSSCAEAVAVATIRTAPSARDPIDRFPRMIYVSSVLPNPAMKSRRRVRDLRLLSNRLRRLRSQGNSVLRKRVGGTSESGPTLKRRRNGGTAHFGRCCRKSRNEQLPKSRKSRFLVASAAASLSRTRTKLCGRSLVIRRGPSHRRARNAPAVLKNLVHLPEKPLSTASTHSRLRRPTPA